MGIYAFVTSEVEVGFPITIGAQDAGDIIIDGEVNENALRAYLLTKALGNYYPPLDDKDTLAHLTDYIKQMEAANDYTFLTAHHFQYSEDAVVLNVTLCYNYNGDITLDDNENMGVALAGILRNAAEKFAEKIGGSALPSSTEVCYTAVSATNDLGEFQAFKEFSDELELENTFDKFVEDAFKDFRFTSRTSALASLAAKGFSSQFLIEASDVDCEQLLRVGILGTDNFNSAEAVYNAFIEAPSTIVKMVAEISDSMTDNDIKKLPVSVRTMVQCYREFEEIDKTIAEEGKKVKNNHHSKGEER